MRPFQTFLFPCSLFLFTGVALNGPVTAQGYNVDLLLSREVTGVGNSASDMALVGDKIYFSTSGGNVYYSLLEASTGETPFGPPQIISNGFPWLAGGASHIYTLGADMRIWEHQPGDQPPDLISNKAYEGALPRMSTGNDYALLVTTLIQPPHNLDLFQVWSLADPADPTFLGAVEIPPAENKPGPVIEPDAPLRIGARALVPGGMAGMLVIDISDPSSPVLENIVMTPDYLSDIEVSGSVGYLAVGDSGVQVVDLADPGNPQLIGRIDTTDQSRFVHCWRDDLLLVGENETALLVFDVSDPSKPKLVGRWGGGPKQTFALTARVSLIYGLFHSHGATISAFGYRGPTPIPGRQAPHDVNGDKRINASDLLILAEEWNP
ncbi:MAG: hypothetical protein HUU16_20590 [Candidatus Omnitrophica bacterium]|nr:hypothetical protein [bacterium]NUN98563.1 hypothetical protein [Candidatus Omnitrophota bacterium]